MLPENEQVIDFLKQVLIFNEFEEDELEKVAGRLRKASVRAGDVIFSQGDERGSMYIIREGEVQVSRFEGDGTETFLAKLDCADIFGEDALYFKRPRSATAVAITDAEMWTLSENDFNWLRNTFSKIEPYLNAFTRTHEIVRKLKIKWLNEEETISLADRRHPISMLGELLLIIFLVFFTLTISVALTSFIKQVIWVTIFSAGMAGMVTVIGLIAGIWTLYEWRNDYFFVTNLRVVWRERILFRASSRQEVPLRRIQSLDVQTSNVLERLISVGDVIIRTFNSEMRLTDVDHPDRMKNMVDAFMQQAQRKFDRFEQAVIRRTIRRQLGTYQEEPALEPDVPTLAVQSERKRLTLFQTRVVEEGAITYRKHWWIFFRNAWKSSLVLILSVVGVFTISGMVLRISGLGGLFIFYLLPVAAFLWWLYQYADWRNDIYKVTKDRIIDRDKKPFGKESFRSAPIINIQSVGHEIPNTIGLILNVGNVRINIGEEILTFDGVHDPALVHQDISRHMEENAANLEKNRIKQEHARMATWLDIYHDETRGEFKAGPSEHIPDFD
jgi:hypothetical protein